MVEVSGYAATRRRSARSSEPRLRWSEAARMGFEPMEALRLQRFSSQASRVRGGPGGSGYIRSELRNWPFPEGQFRCRPGMSGPGR